MSAPVTLDNESRNLALKYVWGQYRTWAITSRVYKNEVSRWRDIVLCLSIGGAILGTLSQQLPIWKLVEEDSLWPRGLGITSAVALALAAYFTKEIFSPDPEARAVRARAVAEALKSEAYTLATDAPPYDTVKTTAELFAKPDNVKKVVESLAPVTITPEQKVEGLLAAGMTIDDYVTHRVDDQIRYYMGQARTNEKNVTKGRWFSVALGAVAVVLGIAATARPAAAAWVAVVGTLTAAIAARQDAGRYQFLIVTYQAAAERLERLKAQWDIDRKTQGTTADQQFILACEEAISAENRAWTAEWTTNSAKSGTVK